MFRFKKRIFTPVIMLFSSLSSMNSLECISISNKECKVRPEIINVNSNEPIFYPYSIRTSKCSSSCNNIIDPRAKLCVPNTIKNLNAKVFNLISWTNETRHMEWYETCKCKCKLDVSVCDNKQRWNEDKCGCGCKELIDKGVCDKGFIWNPSNCECECDKSCDVGEYLDHKNCKCRKRLIDELAEECTENIEETRLVENEHENKCSSSIVYIVLFLIIIAINIGMAIYFIYSRWYPKKIFCLKQASRQQFI